MSKLIPVVLMLLSSVVCAGGTNGRVIIQKPTGRIIIQPPDHARSARPEGRVIIQPPDGRIILQPPDQRQPRPNGRVIFIPPDFQVDHVQRLGGPVTLIQPDGGLVVIRRGKN